MRARAHRRRSRGFGLGCAMPKIYTLYSIYLVTLGCGIEIISTAASITTIFIATTSCTIVWLSMCLTRCIYKCSYEKVRRNYAAAAVDVYYTHMMSSVVDIDWNRIFFGVFLVSVVVWPFSNL